jgi:hypothetical protein
MGGFLISEVYEAPPSWNTGRFSSRRSVGIHTLISNGALPSDDPDRIDIEVHILRNVKPGMVEHGQSSDENDKVNFITSIFDVRDEHLVDY